MRFEVKRISGSFNGRTTDPDSVNRGSTPFPPANHFNNLAQLFGSAKVAHTPIA